MTSDEVAAILGVPVEINGSDSTCSLVFADDSVGSLQAFSGSKAEEGMAVLLTNERFDEATSGGGVALADERGFVVDGSAVVLGDSGRLFRFDTPENAGVSDLQAAMEALADLLLTR